MSNTTGQLKKKVVRGVVWTLLEKWSTMLVSFVVGMVLARILTPEEYGTVALTGIFFAVAYVLVDGGFGMALIQKKDADDLDYNSVFYLNVGLSIFAYVVLFITAPYIAEFYRTPELKNIVRVSAVTLLFNAVNAIQGAELTKKMLFHLSFRISLITTFTSAICGVTLALFGYGVWALVLSTLITGLIGVIARWFIIAWRPKLMFSWSRLHPLFNYGWKMSLSSLLDVIVSNLSGMLIGKFYSKTDLAIVEKGNNLPNILMSQVDGTLGRVTFPALVEMQGDIEKLRGAMRRMIQASTFVVFPLMIGIAVCAKNELLLLYGEQWVPAAPYMMLACFSFALWPFHTINLRGIMVLGRSDIFLKLEVIKKVLKLIVIIVAFRYGVFVFMAMSAFALGPLCVLINAWPNKRLLGYSIRMQVMDVLPTVGICSIMAFVIIGIGMIFSKSGLSYESTGSYWSLALVLAAQVVVGFVIYCLLGIWWKIKPMGEYVQMLHLQDVRVLRSATKWLMTRFQNA